MTDYEREMKPYEVYRVGNFKVQLVRLQINDKGDARVLNEKAHFNKQFLEKNHWEEIQAIRVMSLEELWHVQIPQTYGMFNLIVDIIRWDGKDMTDRLGTILGNMLTVSCVPDGFYHNLVAFLTEALTWHFDDTSSWEDKKEKADKLIADFKWCLDADLEGYKPKEKQDLTDEQYHQDEVADEARETLNK